jgi:murein DD-endopeptidase MepM/ murein hydrolase activator NlpD
MRAVTVSMSPRSLARTIALLTVGFIAANCSSDATRLNENPFASRSSAPESTGSVPPGQAAPNGQIESRPLAAPPMAGQPLPPPAGRRPGTFGGMSGGGQGMGSFQPSADYGRPQAGAPDTTGAVPRLRSEPKSGWNWEGGTPITVAPGDTLASLAQRYGVPAPAIAEANGLSGPAALQPGQRLVIPRYSGPAAAAPAAPRPVATAAPSGAMRVPMSSVHVVAPGETMVGIARRYRLPIADLAAANNMAPHAMLKMGDRLVIPGKSGLGGRTAAATPQPQAAPAPTATAPTRPAASAPVAEKPAPGQQRLAQLEQKETIRVIKPATEDVADDERPSNGGVPSFRWPVKGRVIANFGAKTNGQQNDGIDLAVPEGTAVRAAEDGVVAYAGSELKGYGNLILVRHSNGFVTAYAHASEIMVKRNDQVRRGQVIAKSGQTGNVSAPQLHFEIRKGSSPVDPMQHLAAGG